MTKKVLIITYYWPPAGGSGVQRWLYFTKYLREFGIEPVIFTLDHPQYVITDPSLERLIPDGVEVIRQKIWEPGQGNSKVKNGFLPQKPNTKQRFKNYIRANYFIPDAKILWKRPSVKKLKKYLKKNPVDWIISTGPPHTTHLIAKKLKKKTGIKWLADFRDPWTKIDYWHHLPMSYKTKRKHQALERQVLQQADLVTVVSPAMKRDYEPYTKRCALITNGYDEINLSEIPELDKSLTLTHIGSLNADRNPEMFWEVLKELIDYEEGFEDAIQINLVGHVADEVKQSINTYDLGRFVNFTQYVPSHAATHMQLKSQVLLLFLNDVPSAKGIITGKIFEYLRAKRPILVIAPADGDLAEIINNTQSGKVINFKDRDSLKQALIEIHQAYKSGQLKSRNINIEQYHRKNLTAQLAELLKKD